MLKFLLHSEVCNICVHITSCHIKHFFLFLYDSLLLKTSNHFTVTESTMYFMWFIILRRNRESLIFWLNAREIMQTYTCCFQTQKVLLQFPWKPEGKKRLLNLCGISEVAPGVSLWKQRSITLKECCSNYKSWNLEQFEVSQLALNQILQGEKTPLFSISCIFQIL